MRINSAGAVSIGSSNVTQNSHFNVRQDNNSHATRTYLNANVSSGAFSSIKYLGTIEWLCYQNYHNYKYLESLQSYFFLLQGFYFLIKLVFLLKKKVMP